MEVQHVVLALRMNNQPCIVGRTFLTAHDVASDFVWQIIVVPLRLAGQSCDLLLTFFSHWSVSVVNERGRLLLVVDSTFEHDHDALVHVHCCLLDGLEEPDLGSLQLQQLHLSLLLISVNVVLNVPFFRFAQVLARRALRCLVRVVISSLEVGETRLVVLHQRLEHLTHALNL